MNVRLVQNIVPEFAGRKLQSVPYPAHNLRPTF